MLIKSINIVSFRNFKSASVDFCDGVNIFYGRNGAGKSNLLEAIFVLLLGRSPRGAAVLSTLNAICLGGPWTTPSRRMTRPRRGSPS